MELIDLLNLLWVVVAYVLNTFRQSIKELKASFKAEIDQANTAVKAAEERARSAEVKAGQSITENRVREIMKEEMEPIRSDIKSLSTDIHKALREFDQKQHDLAMAIATGKLKGGG